VQYCGDNPLHFCSQPKNHPGTCGCKCGAIEGVAGEGESRNTTTWRAKVEVVENLNQHSERRPLERAASG
jgi:hypothetical protein